MNITFEFENESEVLARLDGVTPSIADELANTIELLDEQLAAYIVSEKLSGQVLNKVSGKLQASIKTRPVERDFAMITGQVYQDSAIADYGQVHELGGFVPDRYGPMHWIGRDGEDVFRNFARGFDVPERSFMRSALEDMAPAIEDAIIIAIARGLENV